MCRILKTNMNKAHAGLFMMAIIKRSQEFNTKVPVRICIVLNHWIVDQRGSMVGINRLNVPAMDTFSHCGSDEARDACVRMRHARDICVKSLWERIPYHRGLFWSRKGQSPVARRGKLQNFLGGSNALRPASSANPGWVQQVRGTDKGILRAFIGSVAVLLLEGWPCTQKPR